MQVRILGFDESINTCDCCGKSPLKGTFAVERQDGQILHYGSTCVTRHTGKPARVVRQEAKEALAAKQEEARQSVRLHPSYAAYEGRMKEAHRERLVGRDFWNFCRIEREAQAAVQEEIARRHGFQAYEINP